MEYAFFVLGACNDKTIIKLQRLQNRGMRICLQCTPRTSTDLLHEQCRMLTVRNKMKLNTLKIMNRRMYRNNCIDRRDNSNVTRSNRAPLYTELFPMSARFQKSLCGRGFQLWNRLPADARRIEDPEHFGLRMKNEIRHAQLHPNE